MRFWKVLALSALVVLACKEEDDPTPPTTLPPEPVFSATVSGAAWEASNFFATYDSSRNRTVIQGVSIGIQLAFEFPGEPTLAVRTVGGDLSASYSQGGVSTPWTTGQLQFSEIRNDTLWGMFSGEANPGGAPIAVVDGRFVALPLRRQGAVIAPQPGTAFSFTLDSTGPGTGDVWQADFSVFARQTGPNQLQLEAVRQAEPWAGTMRIVLPLQPGQTAVFDTVERSPGVGGTLSLGPVYLWESGALAITAYPDSSISGTFSGRFRATTQDYRDLTGGVFTNVPVVE